MSLLDWAQEFDVINKFYNSWNKFFNWLGLAK